MSKYLDNLNATSDERSKAANAAAAEQAVFAAEGALNSTKSQLATTKAALTASYNKTPFPLASILALKEEEAVLAAKVAIIEAIISSDLK